MLILLQSCADRSPFVQIGSGTGPLVQVGSTAPAVTNNVTTSSACGWDRAFYPDTSPVDFSKRWTHNEMLWLAEHNDKVAEMCAPALDPIH